MLIPRLSYTHKTGYFIGFNRLPENHPIFKKDARQKNLYFKAWTKYPKRHQTLDVVFIGVLKSL
jgi:hypothetical protein